MNIGKKIYYNNTNGYIFMTTGECSGDVRLTSFEEDINSFGILQENDIKIISCIQLEYGYYPNLIPSMVNIATGEIQWINNTTISKNPIKVSNIDTVRAGVIMNMRQICKDNIINNFHSTCLGTDRLFDCERDDQTYMMGLVAKASLIIGGAVFTDMRLNWKATGEPKCYPFTEQQITTLGADLATHLTDTKEHFEDLRTYANDQSRTIDELNAITWDMIINL